MVFSLTSLTPRPPVWQKTIKDTGFFSAPFPKPKVAFLVTLLQYNSPFATTVGPHITFQPLQCTFKRYDKLCEKIEWEKTTDSEGTTTVGQCDHYGIDGNKWAISGPLLRVGFKPKVRFCIQRSFVKSNHMKLDNQCFLNHKSNLQKEWSQDGCRSCMDECGLRVTEARAEDEGEWECKYELPGQSDKVGHHLSFLDSSL